jgi:Protein of unknown function (DUF2971)
LSDIALHRLRISRYADLNDPFELFAGNLQDPRYRRAIRAWRSDFDKSKGLLCFSRKWKNPVLWSHYGDKHRGIALGFDVDDQFIIPVEYSKTRLPVELSGRDTAAGLKADYVRRLVCTKYDHWRYEDEIRLIIGLDEGTLEAGSYFNGFNRLLVLKEVVLGPLCPIPIDAVQSLTTGLYKEQVAVKKARLAFKSFIVVEDETSSRKSATPNATK